MKMFNTIISVVLLSISSYALADVAVIVNPSNSNTISDKDINRIFLGKNKTFADGQNVTAVNLQAKDEARKQFEKKALGKSSKQIKAYWAKLIFTGKAKALKELSSASEVIDFVANTPTAIAYIDASQATDAVKVIKTF